MVKEPLPLTIQVSPREKVVIILVAEEGEKVNPSHCNAFDSCQRLKKSITNSFYLLITDFFLQLFTICIYSLLEPLCLENSFKNL